MYARPYVEFTVVDEAGQQLAGGQRFRAPYQPDPNYKTSIREGSARGVFRIPFQVDDPTQELALYLAVSRSIQEIRVNDVIVQPNVPLDSFSGGAGWEPVFYVLPVAMIRKGTKAFIVPVDCARTTAPRIRICQFGDVSERCLGSSPEIRRSDF